MYQKPLCCCKFYLLLVVLLERFPQIRQHFPDGRVDRGGEGSILVVQPFVEPVLSQHVRPRDEPHQLSFSYHGKPAEIPLSQHPTQEEDTREDERAIFHDMPCQNQMINKTNHPTRILAYLNVVIYSSLLCLTQMFPPALIYLSALVAEITKNTVSARA